MPKDDCILISCEHGGNRIPQRYRELFRNCDTLLQSHRGHDAGALLMARALAKSLHAPLFYATTSRLLIDLNRSIGHPRLFSAITRKLPAEMRGEIVRRHYLPYRSKVEAKISALLRRGGRVIHIASHSFTPELDGVVRNADIGLLYDPARSGEAALCGDWQAQLKAAAPGLKVRRNYPYTGRSDGLTAYLRCRYPDENYVGIELEINQKHVQAGARHGQSLRQVLIEALQRALQQGP